MRVYPEGSGASLQREMMLHLTTTSLQSATNMTRLGVCLVIGLKACLFVFFIDESW